MFGERDTSPPSNRDIAGAWLFCLVLALIAVAVASRLDNSVPAAAIISVMPCAAVCAPVADAEGPATGTVAGLHRFAVPERRPRGEHRKG